MIISFGAAQLYSDRRRPRLQACRRSVVMCVCLLKAIRGVNERGRVVVTGARWHVIMMVIVSSWQRRSVLSRPASATHPLKDVMRFIQ